MTETCSIYIVDRPTRQDGRYHTLNFNSLDKQSATRDRRGRNRVSIATENTVGVGGESWQHSELSTKAQEARSGRGVGDRRASTWCK